MCFTLSCLIIRPRCGGYPGLWLLQIGGAFKIPPIERIAVVDSGTGLPTRIFFQGLIMSISVIPRRQHELDVIHALPIGPWASRSWRLQFCQDDQDGMSLLVWSSGEMASTGIWPINTRREHATLTYSPAFGSFGESGGTRAKLRGRHVQRLDSV